MNIRISLFCSAHSKWLRRLGVERYNVKYINTLQTQDQILHIFDSVKEDLSGTTLHFPKSFNLAAYVNTSETLQTLVQLNVDLNHIEKKPYVAEKILKLNFQKDVKNYIWFLKDFVDSDEIGIFITKNPLILCENLDDLKVRVNYLQSKNFSASQIQRIVSNNPFWLMFSAVRIDRRLGFFQNKLKLTGNDIRFLTVKQPKLITYNLHNVNTNMFVVKEEMGFEDDEVKRLILSKPKILMLNQRALLGRFNYVHNIIKIPHTTILQNPGILMCRNFKVKQRHLFLEKLGRAQYDPKKENYVPLMALAEDTDIEYCKKYAKCNVNNFNIFLKSL